MKISHAVAEGAYPGQNNLFRGGDHILVGGHNGLAAHGGDGVAHAIQIAHAIIYNRNFITHLLAPPN